jgi:hypothetical protein
LEQLEDRALLTHIVRFFDAMGSRARYLYAAFHIFSTNPDASVLLGLLSLAARAGAQCPARQRMAYHTILFSVPIPTVPGSVAEATGSASDEGTFFFVEK